MHTDRSEDRGGVLQPSSPAAAREAYLNGDFAACFASLDAMSTMSAADNREALLLRARALLRQHRSEEVVALVGPALSSFVGVDEACTGRMLHAVAVMRSDSFDRGFRLLDEVDAAARSLSAHRTIRAEIAYWIAYGYWLRRDYPMALRQAAVAEAARADVVSVRAASLRGFVAVAKERFVEGLALFRSALESYQTCRERDPDLVERILVQIASLELTLRSAAVAGTQASRSDAARISDAGARVPGVFRMQIAALDAWLYALDGDRASAYRNVRVAEDLAPTVPWRMWALANRANIALAFGEAAAAAEFAAQAREIVQVVDWEATADEERVGLLFLIEALAVTDPLAAVSAWQRYDGLASAVDRSLVSSADVRLSVIETYVRGLVCRIRGEVPAARDAFSTAYESAERVGYLWRATLALIELDATPIPQVPRERFHLESAARLVTEHFPDSFLARRLRRWLGAHSDPVYGNLARVPREVLRRLLDGRSHKEIAAAMGLSPGTVKNYVVAIHRAFGVSSTPQLFVACHRRGIGTPSWDETDPPACAASKVRTSRRRRV
jgi:DNA-binding CsgD family transcriptional regulator/tetratricopeptide (TPR) repeat protein